MDLVSAISSAEVVAAVIGGLLVAVSTAALEGAKRRRADRARWLDVAPATHDALLANLEHGLGAEELLFGLQLSVSFSRAPDYLRAHAERAVFWHEVYSRLATDEVLSWGYLGDAARLRDEAIAAYRRAAEHDVGLWTDYESRSMDSRFWLLVSDSDDAAEEKPEYRSPVQVRVLASDLLSDRARALLHDARCHLGQVGRRRAVGSHGREGYFYADTAGLRYGCPLGHPWHAIATVRCGDCTYDGPHKRRRAIVDISRQIADRNSDLLIEHSAVAAAALVPSGKDRWTGATWECISIVARGGIEKRLDRASEVSAEFASTASRLLGVSPGPVKLLRETRTLVEPDGGPSTELVVLIIGGRVQVFSGMWRLAERLESLRA